MLAAGNAVNAGSSKGGASAVKLSSLLAAARTKGADGKTTLLDGVVGLILDPPSASSTATTRAATPMMTAQATASPAVPKSIVNIRPTPGLRMPCLRHRAPRASARMAATLH